VTSYVCHCRNKDLSEVGASASISDQKRKRRAQTCGAALFVIAQTENDTYLSAVVHPYHKLLLVIKRNKLDTYRNFSESQGNYMI
jgi:hypothetical protein